MKKEAFKSFVEEKTKESDRVAKIDWEKRKREWLGNLQKFYSAVDGYLEDFVKAGQIKISAAPFFLTEDYLGTYQAEARTISLGVNKIALTPVGTLLIGARGRVDMTGPRASVKFILTGEHSNGLQIWISESSGNRKGTQPRPQAEEDVWKIATPPPRVEFIDLTPETFFNALTETLNG